MPIMLSRALRTGAPARPVVVVLLLASLAAAPSVSAERPAPAREAFSRADSVVEVTRAARTLRLGDRLRVEGLELDREQVGLDLVRFEVFAPDGELVVHGDDGEERRPFRDHVYFRGRVIGEPGSLAVLSVPEDGRVRGIVRREAGLFSIAPGPERADGMRALRAVRAEPTADTPAFTCGTDRLAAPDALTAFQQEAESLAARAGAADGPASLTAAATTTPYTVKVAVETDYELFQQLGSVAAIEAYVGDLIGFASAMYDAETDTNLVVSHLSTYDNPSDPWTQTSSSCALYEFGQYWNHHRDNVDRTIAHFVAGRGSLSGIAWVGVLCRGPFDVNLDADPHNPVCPDLSPRNDSYGGAYGYTGGIQGNFDPLAPTQVWDILAVSHEIGHNFDSPHTHCYNGLGGSSDPVDECYSGDSTGGRACYFGSTSLPGGAGTGVGAGTIMSYCHLLSGGLSNIAFDFGTADTYGHLSHRVPDLMRAHVESRAAAVPACFTRDDTSGGGGDGGTTEPPCPDELVLSSGTVTGSDLEETCGVIYAGGSYAVGGSGDLTLRAFRVVLQDGFAVASGGSLTIDTQ